MDSTAILLEKMDGATFEKLCGQALRTMIPELAALIPSGINTSGRTIKSLADGFCFIEGNHYATMHATTNASNLEKKWLYSGTAESIPNGDLVKAVAEAKEMKASFPAYIFTILLVSSNRVGDNLHKRVNEYITDDFIRVRIIEQRDLVAFLDYNPEGQYLRKEFFGINADRISRSLLVEIAQTNLERYAQENYLEASNITYVSVYKKVEEQLAASATTVNLLTGDSGSGKSTMCVALMTSLPDRYDISLRLKSSMIENAASLEDAIQNQLAHDYPKLYMEAGAIQALFRKGLIIIDDINKSENSAALLDKIISWNQPKDDNSITIVCPVWPRNLSALDNITRKEDKFTIASLGRFTFYDCKAIIQRRKDSRLPVLTDQQIHSLIVDTGFDPLLLDLGLHLLSGTEHYTETIAVESIKKFVEDKIQQLSSRHHFPVHSIHKTLTAFGITMLRTNKMNPHVDDLEKSLGKQTDEYRIITLMAAVRQLFSFDDNGQCFFRHDRVRDYLLIKAAEKSLDDIAANEEVLRDPFHAEIIGAAIASATTGKNDLESLMNANPLALYSCLKYLQDDTGESKLKVVMEVIQEWNTSATFKCTPKAVIESIVDTLTSFDVKNVDTITHSFPSSAELQLAKFRNGDWIAGVNAFSLIDDFYPESPTYWWNSILEHVKAKYKHPVIRELRKFLPSGFTPDGIVHGYTLAGFFKAPELMEALAASWKKYAGPQNYAAYLWAVLNCFTKDHREYVASALSYWSSLDYREKHRLVGKGLSAKSIGNHLSNVDWEFSQEQLDLLLELAADTSMQEILSFLLVKIDHPIAFDVVLSQEMERNESNGRHDWWNGRWERSKTRRRLSQSSLDYLFGEFINPANNPTRRFLAWRYWTGNIESETALKVAQRISSENDSLYSDAVLWRVKHHDYTAATAVQRCVEKKPWQVRVLADIWNEETKTYFSKWFIERVHDDDKEAIAWGLELLTLLDNEDASQSLIQHWNDIKSHPRAIETALFLSTPQTVALADTEIRRLGFESGKPMDNYYYRNLSGTYWTDRADLTEKKKADLLLLAEIFRYLYMHYGTKYEGKPERLTRKKLETLLPYLPLMNSHSMFEFAMDSLRIGAPDLCYEKFFPLMQKHDQRRILLTVEDIKQILNRLLAELLKEGKVHVVHWMQETNKLGVTDEKLTEALESFMQEHHSADAFFIIALLLEQQGSRKDLSLMDHFILEEEGDKVKMEYWKNNTIFLIKRRSLY